MSEAPPPVPRATPTTLGRPAGGSSTVTSSPCSVSQAATNAAISASPAPPGTSAGLTESIATNSASRSVVTAGSGSAPPTRRPAPIRCATTVCACAAGDPRAALLRGRRRGATLHPCRGTAVHHAAIAERGDRPARAAARRRAFRPRQAGPEADARRRGPAHRRPRDPRAGRERGRGRPPRRRRRAAARRLRGARRLGADDADPHPPAGGRAAARDPPAAGRLRRSVGRPRDRRRRRRARAAADRRPVRVRGPVRRGPRGRAPAHASAGGRHLGRGRRARRGPVITDPGPDAVWRAFYTADDVRGDPPARGVEVGSFDEELATVALGRAIAFTSAAAARLYPRPDLAYVPLAGAAPCTVALAWDPERPPTVLASLLAAARRAREQARADGSFDLYGWR